MTLHVVANRLAKRTGKLRGMDCQVSWHATMLRGTARDGDALSGLASTYVTSLVTQSSLLARKGVQSWPTMWLCSRDLQDPGTPADFSPVCLSFGPDARRLMPKKRPFCEASPRKCGVL
eukprot:5422699-Amphidinium_carterae.1